MRKMKEFAGKMYSKLLGAGLALQALCMGIPVYANEKSKTEQAIERITAEGGGLQDTKLVTGTLDLLADATAVALVIESGLVGFLCIKEFIALQQADDQDKPRHKKNIKSIIITGIVVLTITGVLTAVFKYYQ